MCLEFSSWVTQTRNLPLCASDIDQSLEHDLGIPTGNHDIASETKPSFGPPSIADILRVRLHLLFSELYSMPITQLVMDLEASRGFIQRAQAMLTIPTVMRLIDVFFITAPRHFPAFHLPSFNPLTVRPSLLFAVIMLGATASGDNTAATIARDMFDILSAFVFNQPVFVHDPPSEVSSQEVGRALDQIEEIQAAFCVILMQEYEGSAESRVRTRMVNHTLIIKVK
jgi:Fungal specific transcription factor domain